MEVEFPDGTVVQATGYQRGDDREPQWGLYLDARWKPAWPHVVVDWEDFGLPADPVVCDRAIVDAFERARTDKRVEVGCLGGRGRTGTVLGCMAVLAGVPGDEA